MTFDQPLAGAPRVLVVDDEPAICRALSRVLLRAGFDPVTACSAADADRALDTSIDAMVLDLRLSYTRGDVFFHQATARFPKLRGRTLMMSGDTSPEAERLAGLAGCLCLFKPFRNAELTDALRRFFAGSETTASAR